MCKFLDITTNHHDQNLIMSPLPPHPPFFFCSGLASCTWSKVKCWPTRLPLLGVGVEKALSVLMCSEDRPGGEMDNDREGEDRPVHEQGYPAWVQHSPSVLAGGEKGKATPESEEELELRSCRWSSRSSSRAEVAPPLRIRNAFRPSA